MKSNTGESTCNGASRYRYHRDRIGAEIIGSDKYNASASRSIGPQNTPEVGYPSISYNAPVMRRFSVKTGKYQTITGFIEAIERQALLE